MTIPSTARKAGPLLGTGVQTAWPFTFKVFAESDIAVAIANALGTETALVLDTDYSVTLNGNQETSPGGTVTYPISGTPLATGSVLSIVGDLDYDQPLDLPSGGNFSPLALENELDRLAMQIQQLREENSRALLVPVTSDAAPSLPFPEANQLIGWDATGSTLQNVPISDLATAVAYGTFRYDTFTGNGVTTAFPLTSDPAAVGNLDVAVDGLTMMPGADYALASGVLVFTVAPTNGAEVLARYGQAIPSVLGADAAAISYQPAGVGSAVTDVQTVLRRRFIDADDFIATSNTASANVTGWAALVTYVNTLTTGAHIQVSRGTYLFNGPIAAPKNSMIAGEGRVSTTFSFSNAGDGIQSTWPINSSSAVHIAIRDINIECTNGSNTGGGFVDVGGSFLELTNVRLKGWKYNAILDQSELADITLCDFESCITAGLWLVNGSDHTIGASPQFTNRISVSKCQFNTGAGTLNVIDDGGYSHAFYSNNFNGGSKAIRCAGVFGLNISMSNEFEGQTTGCIDMQSTTFNSGTGVGGNTLSLSGGNTISVGAGYAVNVAVTGVQILISSGNIYAGASTKIVGTTNLASFSSDADYITAGVFTDADVSAIDYLRVFYRRSQFRQSGNISPMEIFKADATGGGAPLAGLDFSANNSAPSKVTYSRIRSAIYGNAAGSEIGALQFYTIAAGVDTLQAEIRNTGMRVVSGFGCNGKAPQAPVASGGVLANVVAALIANGILSS